jgi:hypothetical protein
MLPPFPTPSKKPTWFKVHDEHVSSLTISPSSSLSHVKSVKQIEGSKNVSLAEQCDTEGHLPNTNCKRHLQTPAFCSFRPCSHYACHACYIEASSKRNLCPFCGQNIARLVIGQDDGNGATIESTIIHIPFDRVSPLYSSFFPRAPPCQSM